jgi:hypothetical protein
MTPARPVGLSSLLLGSRALGVSVCGMCSPTVAMDRGLKPTGWASARSGDTAGAFITLWDPARWLLGADRTTGGVLLGVDRLSTSRLLLGGLTVNLCLQLAGGVTTTAVGACRWVMVSWAAE